MRFDPKNKASQAIEQGMESRWIDRTDDVVTIKAPRDWTSARLESWLDWANSCAVDYPATDDLPADLTDASPARDEDIYRGAPAAAASTPAAGHVPPPAPRDFSSKSATEF